MSEQTVYILIRLLLRSSLIRIYTVCHFFYIFWRHYCIVKANCFISRTTLVVSLGVPIFRVFTVHSHGFVFQRKQHFCKIAIKSTLDQMIVLKNQGTVVQSIVSLTNSLRCQLKCFMTLVL